jgi:hypothetical protein
MDKALVVVMSFMANGNVTADVMPELMDHRRCVTERFDMERVLMKAREPRFISIKVDCSPVDREIAATMMKSLSGF